ncbi:cytoskeleton protein RodZ [Microbulbifer aestuariivivens]|uniref:Cytoskeleton protein RodZ n=1 Tax=Microbulbifer aestuariivivens TaxID=1908308 RepID=A0ABP9WS66_9GAMM
MTDKQAENAQAPVETAASRDEHPSPGSQLRAAREAAGLSLDELSSRLRMTRNKLEWLELDQYDRLSGALYVRGYIRNVCKELGVDPEPVLQAFSGYSAAEEESRVIIEHVTRGPVIEEGGKGGYGFLKVLPLIAVAGIFWWFQGRDSGAPTLNDINDSLAGQAAEAAALDASLAEYSADPALVESALAEADTVAPSADEPAAAELAPAAAGEAEAAVAEVTKAGSELSSVDATVETLELRFSEEAWIEVKDARGTVLLATLQAQGSTVELEGQPPFSLMLGNAAGTEVRYRNQVIPSDPLGSRRTRRLTVGETQGG